MLTARQARFVEEFLEIGNGTQAAIRAGYEASSAHVTASRQLRNAKVCEAIAARRIALSQVFEIRREDVLAGFLVAIQRASDQDNPAAMISGWREVAKLLGFNEPERISVQLSDDHQGLRKKYEQMSDQELLEIASRDARN